MKRYRQQPAQYLSYDIRQLQGELSSSYDRFHEANGRFPSTLEELAPDSWMIRYLTTYKTWHDYSIVDRHAMRFTLTDRYGYHRWIELTPKNYQPRKME